MTSCRSDGKQRTRRNHMHQAIKYISKISFGQICNILLALFIPAARNGTILTYTDYLYKFISHFHPIMYKYYVLYHTCPHLLKKCGLLSDSYNCHFFPETILAYYHLSIKEDISETVLGEKRCWSYLSLDCCCCQG